MLSMEFISIKLYTYTYMFIKSLIKLQLVIVKRRVVMHLEELK